MSGANDVTADSRASGTAGQVVDVPTSPARVVVFDMSLLDSLDTLGVPVAGLPKQNVGT